MSTYHKINGVYKRYTKDDFIPKGKKKGDFIDGEYSKDEFRILENCPWEWTEKIDGMNCRIIVEGDEISLKGKTDNASIPSPLQEWFDQWSHDYKTHIHNTFPDGAILYGEGVGKKIQKGKHGFVDYRVILFDVRVGRIWLKKESTIEIANNIALEHVPFLRISTLRDEIQNFYDTANRFVPSMYGDFQSEGVVGIPVGGMLDRTGNRIITKLKYCDFR